jgi:hypothetical protein
VRKACSNASLTLPIGPLTRISDILGIRKALVIPFPIEAEAKNWLKGPHYGEVFGGEAPVALLVEDGLDGILALRDTSTLGSRRA